MGNISIYMRFFEMEMMNTKLLGSARTSGGT
jgi:hypothetical protein